MADIISLLLKVSASHRPNCDEILSNPVVKRHIHCVQIKKEDEDEAIDFMDDNIDLINTIRVPMNLQKLTTVLPKSNYEPSEMGSVRQSKKKKLSKQDLNTLPVSSMLGALPSIKSPQ